MDEITTPIIAYKFVAFGGENFHSPSYPHRWLPGWNVISNGPLDVDGSNGFYTYKDRASNFTPPGLCQVEMEIAGKVIECERGYRSEFARISRFIDRRSVALYDYKVREVVGLYELDHSTERVRSAWPKKTPYTRVWALPSWPLVDRYNIPIIPEPTAANYKQEGGAVIIPYSVLTITLDMAHSDGRRYYQYGYNAEHDILVYRELEE